MQAIDFLKIVISIHLKEKFKAHKMNRILPGQH